MLVMASLDLVVAVQEATITSVMVLAMEEQAVILQ
jgi:hypothetical protein